MRERKIKKEDLRLAASLTANQLTNMGKGLYIGMETLPRICKALDCDIADVIEPEQAETDV